jgi:fatty-acyl-CoA synthase
MEDRAMTTPTTGTQTLRALARYPDRIAFAWDGGEMSYRATAEIIGRIQRVFAAAGLVRTRRVALLAGNCAHCWCAGAAAMASGLSITWLHPAASLPDQLYQVADAEADALVVDAVHFPHRADELAAQLPAGVALFVIGHRGIGTDLLTAIATVGSGEPLDVARPDDVAILNYTGGTTGKPKGVLRRQRSIVSYMTSILADFELPATPRYLAVAPISHVGGTKILPCLMRGGTVHLMTGFDPARMLKVIVEQRINFTLAVPTMVYALLDLPELDRSDLSSLELLLYGAASMSPSRLEEGLRRIGPVFSQLYGQTECYPATVLRKADHDPARPALFSSCGFPVANVDVRLLDDEGGALPQGASGEICLRSPFVMEAYWKQPELTAETLKHGWLHTGDIGRFDEQGYLYIVDRKKDMVVSGGFNVYPREVEDALTTHPAVAMAAVVGLPDPKWGEAVTAIIVLRPDAAATEDELIAHVKGLKGSLLAPKRVFFADGLTTTSVGKVDKKALRERYRTAR